MNGGRAREASGRPEERAAAIDILGVGHAPILRVNRGVYQALRRLGWRVELAIPARLPWSSETAQPDHADDPPIHRLPAKGGSLRTWTFEGLRRLLNARAPRIVYLENGPDSRMAWEIGRWCARHGAKLVLNTNENDIPPVLQALRSRGIRHALRSLRTRLWVVFTRRYIAHIVAISRTGRDAMASLGFGKAVSVTPLGYERRLFYPDAARRAAMRARLGLRHTVVAYFGRLGPHKGVHVLIAALGRLTALPWQFLIDDFEHAPGDYAGRLRRAIDDAGIAGRTTFFTATHDEMPDYMRAADIVVVPSVWREQYGRVAPEAMACGCAVVVSDAGALPELVGSAGVVVPAGDTEALAGAISRLITDPDGRGALAAAGEKRARISFTADRQAALLDRLFRSLLSRPRDRSAAPAATGAQA